MSQLDRSRISLSTQDQCKKWHVKLLMSIYHGVSSSEWGEVLNTYKNFISD